MKLLELLRSFCLNAGFEKTYWVALSGGLDSCVLLHLLSELRQQFPISLKAIHINHQLSPNAQAWATHCVKMCAEWNIELMVHSIQLNLDSGDSLEEVARQKRYAIFAEYIQVDDVLLTAHQQDDQAETLFLQLLRGAGPKGMSAMPILKKFAEGLHARPLLECSRTSLQEYASLQQLQWIDDESNNNLKFTRNFIRHEIISKLKSHWPTVTNALARSARMCAETQTLLEDLALPLYFDAHGTVAGTLSITKLLSMDIAKQRLILRMWIQRSGFVLPNEKKMMTIQNNLLLAGRDSCPCVEWGNVEVRRYRDDIYILNKLKSHCTKQIWSWDFSSSLTLPGIGILECSQIQNQGLRANLENINIRFRQGGEAIRLRDSKHRTLKNLFQEWGIPPWQRSRIPLVYADDRLISVVGFHVDEEFTAQVGEVGVKLALHSDHLECLSSK